MKGPCADALHLVTGISRPVSDIYGVLGDAIGKNVLIDHQP